MRSTLAILAAAGLALAACSGPNPDPGAGNTMAPVSSGPGTVQTAPARAVPTGGQMAPQAGTGGTTQAAPQRAVPTGGSMAPVAGTGGVTPK